LAIPARPYRRCETGDTESARIAATAADLLCGRLFEIAPEVRASFPDDLSGQKKTA